MDFISIFVVALGLSADAFAASLGLGICSKKTDVPRRAIMCGCVFGLFQAAMPILGFVLASVVGDKVRNYDHWIAFVLLGYIGVTMIIDSAKELKRFKKTGSVCETKDNWNTKNLLILGVATSIDAFAAGISLSLLGADIFSCVALIGVTTFVLSAVGLWCGNAIGGKLKSYAGFCGGIMLIGIGVKTLIEHLFLGG